jgi:hypothetical protein
MGTPLYSNAVRKNVFRASNAQGSAVRDLAVFDKQVKFIFSGRRATYRAPQTRSIAATKSGSLPFSRSCGDLAQMAFRA